MVAESRLQDLEAAGYVTRTVRKPGDEWTHAVTHAPFSILYDPGSSAQGMVPPTIKMPLLTSINIK